MGNYIQNNLNDISEKSIVKKEGDMRFSLRYLHRVLSLLYVIILAAIFFTIIN